MRKILLNVAVTLDGFIEGPGGEYDWCFTDQDYGMTDFLASTDTILFGRKSYELLLATDANAWPTHKRYVFSRTAGTMEGATVINGSIERSIEKIMAEKGKDIWLFGGADLASSFLNLGMINEFLLSIHPILLGNGKRLFNGFGERKNLMLKERRSYSSGLVQLVYTYG